MRLVGSKSNRDGLGAVVTVTADGGNYTKVNDGLTGYLSHGVVPLYFGLGAAQSVSVSVQWPSGEVTKADEVGANTLLVLEEPADR